MRMMGCHIRERFVGGPLGLISAHLLTRVFEQPSSLLARYSLAQINHPDIVQCAELASYLVPLLLGQDRSDHPALFTR